MSLLNSTPDLVVKRETPATRGEDGEWVPAGSTRIQIKGSVQPLKGRELQALPEGIHDRAEAKLYTKTELVGVGSEQDGQVPDLIKWRDRWYELRTLQDWEGGGLSLGHFKYILLAPEVGPG